MITGEGGNLPVVVSLFKKKDPAENDEHKKKDRDWWDCGDCGSPDCGSPDCSCDIPGCDCGFASLSLLCLLLRRDPTRPRRPRTRPTAPGRLGMAAIRGYQRWLSPRLRARCRHVPNCSAYGMAAVRRYGLLQGSTLTADRIRRCTAPTPYGTTDPVP